MCCGLCIDVLTVSMRLSVILCIQNTYNKILGVAQKTSTLLNLRTHVFVKFKIKSCEGVFRIEETKIVCAISRKLIFG